MTEIETLLQAWRRTGPSKSQQALLSQVLDAQKRATLVEAQIYARQSAERAVECAAIGALRRLADGLEEMRRQIKAR